MEAALLLRFICSFTINKETTKSCPHVEDTCIYKTTAIENVKERRQLTTTATDICNSSKEDISHKVTVKKNHVSENRST